MSLSSLVETFRSLSDWLLLHREMWVSQPFISERLGWEEKYPDLSQALRGLSDELLNDYDREAWKLPIKNAYWEQWLKEAESLVKLPKVSTLSTKKTTVDIKYRKWRQIQILIDGVLNDVNPPFWVDWCGGKGHLLRSLVTHCGQQGVVIDCDDVLCDMGRVLAQEHNAADAMHFYCADVLKDPLPHHFFRDACVAGLHACGRLSDAAISYGIQGGAHSIVLVPCCYHRLFVNWKPYSELGHLWDIGLTNHALRLPSLQEQHLRNRRRKLRYQQLAYRLGFRFLFEQCEHGNVPELPSLPRRYFYMDFDAFCAAVCQKLDIQLPETPDFSDALSYGWRRSGEARRLGLIHTPFRRAIEMWINLDRALFLHENGYDCQVFELCEASVTPRNIVLFATRQRIQSE